MKLRSQKQRSQALTRIDVVVIIFVVLIILAVVLLPVLAAANRRSSRIGCIGNLGRINIPFRVWEDDHNNQYPMSISITNKGAMELAATGNVAGCFQVMSNELSTPKILICPQDTIHTIATNFQNDFNNSHISYFINPDASEGYPQEIMLGDANLAINGIPVKSGLVAFPSGASVSFTAARHIHVGNIGYADGSVAEVSSTGLQQALDLSTNGTPVTTNRLAIP